MRILITADTVGGVWDYTCTLARAVHDAGHDVLLAVLGDKPDRRLAALPEGVEITARPYRLEWMPDSAADVRDATRWLTGLAALWEADVVHLNQFAYAAARFPAPVVVVAHSDVVSWFSEARGQEPTDDWDEYRGWVAEGLEAADVVVTPTQYQSELLVRHFGRGADRVIHNGVASPELASPSASEPLVVFAGRAWDEAKGLRVLDEAVGRLGPAAPPVHLLGGTSGPNGELFSPVHLTAHGRVERTEVNSWLERATIYVAPSLYEPFGLAPLEAALHGCALVLSDIGSFRELWDGCAEFFPPGDSAALAEVLASLADRPERLTHLGAGARRRAERRYSAARMAGQYLSLYAELGGAAGTARPPRAVAPGA